MRTLRFVFSVSILLVFSLKAYAEDCSDFGVGVSTLKNDAANSRGDYTSKLKTDALQFSSEGDQKILLYWTGITFDTKIEDSQDEP